MVGAFDQIGHEDDVADAFTTVRSKIARRCFSGRLERVAKSDGVDGPLNGIKVPE
jgi:hypothetical protein